MSRALVCLLFIAGCQTSRQAWISTGVGVGVAGLGAAIVSSADGEGGEGPVAAGGVMLMAGTISTVVSLINALALSGEE